MPWLSGNRDSCHVRMGIGLGAGALAIRQQRASYFARATGNGALDDLELDGSSLSNEWAHLVVFELWAPMIGVGPFYTAILQRAQLAAVERPANITVQNDSLVEFRGAQHLSLAAVAGVGLSASRVGFRSEFALGYRYFGYNITAYRGERVGTRSLLTNTVQCELRTLFEVWPHEHLSISIAAGVDPTPPFTISTTMVVTFHMTRLGGLAIGSRPHP
ncbi:MAG: hypothetical protein JNK05_02150 [Myxococcales bacterium]|nr:hypothetical protein [Myxococcales bacterium]